MKVGQKVLVRTIHRISLCGYKHRHKLYVKPPGWNIWGNIEVKEIMEVLQLMVEVEEGDISDQDFLANLHDIRPVGNLAY